MTVIVGNDICIIIEINTLKGNDGHSKIPADVFYNVVLVSQRFGFA